MNGATTALGTQEPSEGLRAERQQTEWTGHWLCICQQSGISLNPPPAAKRVRHHGHSQLSAGLLPFRFPGRPAAGCPFRSSRFPDTGRSAKPGVFEVECSEPAIRDLTHSARRGPTGLRPKAATRRSRLGYNESNGLVTERVACNTWV